jgi:hypothetical protein
MSKPGPASASRKTLPLFIMSSPVTDNGAEIAQLSLDFSLFRLKHPEVCTPAHLALVLPVISHCAKASEELS